MNLSMWRGMKLQEVLQGIVKQKKPPNNPEVPQRQRIVFVPWTFKYEVSIAS